MHHSIRVVILHAEDARMKIPGSTAEDASFMTAYTNSCSIISEAFVILMMGSTAPALHTALHTALGASDAFTHFSFLYSFKKPLINGHNLAGMVVLR